MEDRTVLVILTEDVVNLGEMGETVKVTDGFARNYLLPRRLAVQADSASAKEIEHQQRIIKRKEAKRREEQLIVAEEMKSIKLTFKRHAGDQDKLFGSVTSANIAEELAERGYFVDRRNIKLPEPIKAIGMYTIEMKLGGGVEASITVTVERDETVDEAEKRAQAELADAELEEMREAAREAEEELAESEADEPKAAAAAGGATEEAAEEPTEA